MKQVIVEVLEKGINLNYINKNGKKTTILFSKYVEFSKENPIGSINNFGTDVAASQKMIDEFSEFVCIKLKEFKIQTKKVIIAPCDRFYARKEFFHQKISDSNLDMLTKLEADSILHDKSSEYILQTFRCGDVINEKNEVVTVLYALLRSVANYVVKTFRKKGIIVTKIAPINAGHTYSYKNLVFSGRNGFTKDKCFATIHYGATGIKVTVFYKNSPIHFKDFESSNSQIIEKYIKEKNIDPKLVNEYILKQKIFDENADEFTKEIALLIKNDIDKVLRAIHFTVSSMRYNIDNIILSGIYSKIPDFDKYLAKTYDVKVSVFTTIYPQYKNLINIKESNQSHFTDGLTVYGILNCSIDFTKEISNAKRSKAQSKVLATIVTVFAVFVMAVLPVALLINQIELKMNDVNLSLPKYAETMKLNLYNENLLKLISTKTDTIKTLDNQRTEQNKVFNEIITKIGSKGQLTNIFQKSENEINLDIIVKEYGVFPEIKRSVLDSKIIEIDDTFIGSKSDTGVTYNITVRVKG